MHPRLWLAAALLLLPASLLGQNLHYHAMDFAANVGFSNLAGASPTQAVHESFGFTAAINAVHHVAVGAEYDYAVLGTLQTASGPIPENQQHFGGTIRVAVLDRKKYHVAPYLVAGGGLTICHDPAFTNGASSRVTIYGGYASGGAGASFFLFKGFGIRPEFRIEHSDIPNTSVGGIPVTITSNTIYHGTVGVFYQF